MPQPLLSAHEGLLTHRRRPWSTLAGHQLTLADWTTLAICGIAAAMLTDLVEWNLRLPGHAILRGVMPLALGLALVPRHGAGTAMGLASLATSLVLRSSGGSEGGLGSLTSVALLGPLMDLLLVRARSGGWIYAGIIGAAILANLIALAVQAGGRWSLGRPLAHWIPLAAVTYPLFGLLAGFLSAAIAFQFRAKRDTG